MKHVARPLFGLMTLVFAALVTGCGGASSPDVGPSDAPPITAESSENLAKEINAQKGDMKPAP